MNKALNNITWLIKHKKERKMNNFKIYDRKLHDFFYSLYSQLGYQHDFPC